jgi:hypothetical protein
LEKKDIQISKSRLFSQQIIDTQFETPKEIVSWMGAMQAQDYIMAKWAVGVRLKNQTEKNIEEAIDKGEILRTHVLRPTWHFVSPDDIYWMTKLTAAKIKSSLTSRHKQLEITDSILKKTIGIMEKEMGDGVNLTRNDLAQKFRDKGIKTDENRLSHILFCAEFEAVICSGPIKENRPTYSLLSHRVPKKKELGRDESLAELAKRYFTSHAPATIQDFSWWSNLSLTEIRRAVDSIKSDFTIEETNTGKYLLPGSFSLDKNPKNSIYLLPAYDEFLISYRDRSHSLHSTHNKKTISSNGIFFPIVVINGQVSGLWQRTIQKNKLIVTINTFQEQGKTIKNQIAKKAAEYGKFLDKETDVIFKVSEVK